MSPPKRIWLVSIDHSYIVFTRRVDAARHVRLMSNEYAMHHIHGHYVLSKKHSK